VIWLSEAMVVNTCLNATDPNIGLALSADRMAKKVCLIRSLQRKTFGITRGVGVMEYSKKADCKNTRWTTVLSFINIGLPRSSSNLS